MVEAVGAAVPDPASLQRLRSLLELCLRTAIVEDPSFTEDLTCTLESSRLVDQLEAVHRAASEPAGGPSSAAARRQVGLKGYAAFTLDYRAPWPLSIVLSRKAITKYQLLFRHLFFCRHVERRLGASWMAHQSCKELNLRTQLATSYALRQRMLHFIQNLVHYMTFEVVEPRWHEMALALPRCETVDEVIARHDEFLDAALKECLLTSQDLLKPLNKLVTLCLLFANRMAAEIETHRPDEEEVARRAGLGTPPAVARRRGLRGGRGRDVEEGDDYEFGRGLRPEAATMHQWRLRQARLHEMGASMQHTMAQQGWQGMILRSADMFDKLFRQFMARLLDRAASEFRTHLVHLCARLDFNGFYSAHFNMRITDWSHAE